MPPLNLKDVAKAAGVSKSTVQRALTGHPKCAPETREHVLKIASELGYKPHPLFAGIGARNEHKRLDEVPIAYLDFIYPGEPVIGAPYSVEVAKRADQLGYTMHEFNVGSWENPKQVWKVLYARGFAGILLGRVHARDLPILLLNDLFPVVCCGRFERLPFHTVRGTVVEAVHRLWNRMVQMGYKRIGASIGLHTPEVEDDFSRRAAISACQDSVPAKNRVPPWLGRVNDRISFMEWFNRYEPDAVMGFQDNHYWYIVTSGHKVPEEIGYAGLHRGRMEDPISGYDQNYQVIGECAMNLLDQMIRHGEQGPPANPLNVLVDPIWIEHGTLREPWS